MRVYKNDMYGNRNFTWRRPTDADPYEQDPRPDSYDEDYRPSYWYDEYPCRKPYPPYPCPDPYHYPVPEPGCYKYPFPQPYPIPYPVPCPRQECEKKHEKHDEDHCEKKCEKECEEECEKRNEFMRQAFGYFASITAGGAFAGGTIPFTFTDPVNRNVRLLMPNNTQVSPQVSGIYRVVYSVTTTAAAPGVSLQLLLNGQVVTGSAIPIQEGVNVNEIFLDLNRNDTLSLNLTGPVTLAAGKNASLLLQLVERTC